MTHDVEVTLSAVAMPHGASVLVPVKAVPIIVSVSVVMAIVIVVPAAPATNIIAEPIGKAVVPFAGIVTAVVPLYVE